MLNIYRYKRFLRGMNFCLLLCVLSLYVAASGYAEEITVDADDSSSDQKSGITTFTSIKKRVKIVRESGDYLYADKATVYRNVETDELIKVEADGNVEMKEGEKIATCQHALINEAEDWIEMTGSAKVVEKDTVTEANKITYYRKENRLETRGNSRFKFRMKDKEKPELKKESSEKK